MKKGWRDPVARRTMGLTRATWPWPLKVYCTFCRVRSLILFCRINFEITPRLSGWRIISLCTKSVIRKNINKYSIKEKERESEREEKINPSIIRLHLLLRIFSSLFSWLCLIFLNITINRTTTLEWISLMVPASSLFKNGKERKKERVNTYISVVSGSILRLGRKFLEETHSGSIGGIQRDPAAIPGGFPNSGASRMKTHRWRSLKTP